MRWGTHMRRRTRMTRWIPALVGGVAAALSAADPLPAQTLDLEEIEAVADSVAGWQIAEGLTPGMSVAVARDGEIIFAQGYGEADVEMGVAAGPETVYRIGSLTKQFTAAIVMRLVEAGEVSLDDSITEYLPDYPTQGHHVTVRHLLNHTSGIKSITGVDPGFRHREFRLDLSDEELLDLFAELPFDFEPGEEYRYNNSGYVLLGMIIEEATGTPYAAYVERELLEPLGLDHTWYCDNRRVIPNRAEGYAYDDGELVNSRYLSMRIPGAAGALCSTVGDLVRWTRLLHGGRVVSPESLRQMTDSTVLSTGETVSYGYGLDVGRLLGRPVVVHGGSTSGFVGYLVHYPDDGLTIAVLMNSVSGQRYAVAEALSRTAFGMERVVVPDLPLTAEDIARYEGTYTLRAGSRTLDLRVFGDDGQLKAQPAGQGVTRLRYQGDHTFITVVDDDVRLVFTVENGRAEGVTLHDGDAAIPGKRKP